LREGIIIISLNTEKRKKGTLRKKAYTPSICQEKGWWRKNPAGWKDRGGGGFVFLILLRRERAHGNITKERGAWRGNVWTKTESNSELLVERKEIILKTSKGEGREKEF